MRKEREEKHAHTRDGCNLHTPWRKKCLARFPDLPSARANSIDRIDFQPWTRTSGWRTCTCVADHVYVRAACITSKRRRWKYPLGPAAANVKVQFFFFSNLDTINDLFLRRRLFLLNVDFSFFGRSSSLVDVTSRLFHNSPAFGLVFKSLHDIFCETCNLWWAGLTQ